MRIASTMRARQRAEVSERDGERETVIRVLYLYSTGIVS
jgi:hypothetical protein